MALHNLSLTRYVDDGTTPRVKSDALHSVLVY